MRPRASTASPDQLPMIPEKDEPEIDEEAQKRLRIQKGLCEGSISSCGTGVKVALCFCVAFGVAAGISVGSILKLSHDEIYDAC